MGSEDGATCRAIAIAVPSEGPGLDRARGNGPWFRDV